VAVALDYALAGLEHGEERSAVIPAVLLTQARMAARNGVSLDTVLRRYVVGFTLFVDDLISAVHEGDKGDELQSLVRDLSVLFDHLLVEISKEHGREESRPLTSEKRQAERVGRLLKGDPVDVSELAYELDAVHIGLIATGGGVTTAVRRLASSLDRRLLLIEHDEETVWAWLGGRRVPNSADLKRLIPAMWPDHIALAMGEAGEGLPGWRHTHRQARAAMPIAMLQPTNFALYSDAPLLASILDDDILSASLYELYLAPIELERDDGKALREALRAYFSTGRNGTSAAALLGVSRQTISKRLQAVEERIGRPLVNCATELETALRLESLGLISPLGPKRRVS
jgi:predicted DNA-binding protein (UPF0251 family)